MGGCRQIRQAGIGCQTYQHLTTSQTQLLQRAVDAAAAELLERAEDLDVIEIDGTLVRFTHPLLASAVYAMIGNPLYLSWCPEGLAGVAAARGEWEHAARLCGERDGVLARMDSPLPPVYEAGYARTLSAIHEHLPSGV